MAGEVSVARFAACVAVLAALSSVMTVLAPPTTRYTAYAPASRDTPLYRIAVVGDSYTAGGELGGLGAEAWTARTWQLLSRRGVQVRADVAAEGGAGYGVPGNRGSVFEGLAANSVRADDALVVFYGSRNDQPADPVQLPVRVGSALDMAHRAAPNARLLVIGPPWPTADVPQAVYRIRDVLASEASRRGATFVDPLAERWFVGRPDLIGSDGVHPTDAGHAYMAERIAPLIAAALARQR